VKSQATRRTWFALITMAVALCGCKESDPEDPTDIIAQLLVGPAGDTLETPTFSLRIPSAALTADTELVVRRSDMELSALDFHQLDQSFAIEPAGLVLRQPAELTFLEHPSESPAVLFTQDGVRVGALGEAAYLNELGPVAAAEAGNPLVRVAEPNLGTGPAGPGELHRDVAHLRLAFREPAMVPRVNLSMTIYDSSLAYTRPLNGTSEGDCGFELENVAGGSLTAGCAEGPVTASVRVTSDVLDFDVVPFLAGKLATPVVVGVVAGNETLSYHLGFFAFATSACFQETCSGRGTCIPEGEGGACMCDEGYAALSDPFACECVPQCEGRACGGDNCGGSCGDCGGGLGCQDGVCI